MSHFIQRLRDRQNNEDGFTLVELLVVIVVLGVLASIVVFALGGINSKAESNASATEKKTLETAEEAYFVANGSYAAEGALVPSFLKTESSRWNVCLTLTGDPATATDYSVVDNGTDCP